MTGINPIASPEAIIDRWSALITGAQGKGNELLASIEQILHAVQVPKLRLGRKEVSRKKALSFGMEEQNVASRTYLVVENEYLGSYKMYVGVSDYGKQLSVQWYLMLAPHDWTKFLMIAGAIALAVIGLFAWKVWLGIVALLAGGWYLWREFKKNKEQTGGLMSIAFMDLLDLEELSNYTTTVHHATTGAVESLMTGMNLDFSKVDTVSKGFLKIS